MQLPLEKGTKATLISAYAPTMTNPEDTKDKFYEELDALITDVPQPDKLIVLGEFNARVGTDHKAWDRVIGKHGVGKCNSNGSPPTEDMCHARPRHHQHHVPPANPQ